MRHTVIDQHDRRFDRQHDRRALDHPCDQQSTLTSSITVASVILKAFTGPLTSSANAPLHRPAPASPTCITNGRSGKCLPSCASFHKEVLSHRVYHQRDPRDSLSIGRRLTRRWHRSWHSRCPGVRNDDHTGLIVGRAAMFCPDLLIERIARLDGSLATADAIFNREMT